MMRIQDCSRLSIIHAYSSGMTILCWSMVFTGITAIGRVTIRILQMNASQYDIELRQYLVELGLW